MEFFYLLLFMLVGFVIGSLVNELIDFVNKENNDKNLPLDLLGLIQQIEALQNEDGVSLPTRTSEEKSYLNGRSQAYTTVLAVLNTELNKN